MANSLPFNAVAVDGEYDRVYKAEDWAWYFATFIANGIFPKPSDGLQVVAYSGMEIRVNAGYAFINGYAFRNPATLSVTLDAKTGETTGKGVFTIVEVKAGQGASVGWGRLKSGAGWISLDYATRLA